MTVEAIPNFDSYAWIAIGLFVLGMVGILFYEKSETRQHSTRSSGKPSDVQS